MWLINMVQSWKKLAHLRKSASSFVAHATNNPSPPRNLRSGLAGLSYKDFFENSFIRFINITKRAVNVRTCVTDPSAVAISLQKNSE
jgi:hypothetical protein